MGHDADLTPWSVEVYMNAHVPIPVRRGLTGYRLTLPGVSPLPNQGRFFSPSTSDVERRRPTFATEGRPELSICTAASMADPGQPRG